MQWKEKQFYRKFVREIEEIRSEKTWEQISKGYSKKETKDLIFPAQEQALRTNWIRKNVDVQVVSEKCSK